MKDRVREIGFRTPRLQKDFRFGLDEGLGWADCSQPWLPVPRPSKIEWPIMRRFPTQTTCCAGKTD
jgi:hypothetical protein